MDSTNPTDDTLLSRPDLAAALTKMGYPIRATTLAVMGSKGTGPDYIRFGGKKTLYRWKAALDWAKGRCTPGR